MKNRFCRPIFLSLVILCVFALPCFASSISQSQEIKIGAQGAKKIEAKYGLVTNAEQVAKIERLGNALAANRSRNLTYHFKILNSDMINALAFPGGFVYVTKGIMKVMPENELAFVMGHEIGHVECRHSVKALEQSAYLQLGGNVLLSLLSGGKKVDKNAATALTAANTVIDNRYSQSAEKEADRMGIILMAKAGYDPEYAVDALETLKKHDGKGMPGFLNSFLGTHPLTSERIELAKEFAPTVKFDD